jgi:hypothetical protein
MKQLRNTLSAPVIDRYGYLLETREIRNCALTELWPDEKIVLVQWTAQDDPMRLHPPLGLRTLRPQRLHQPEQDHR